MASTFASIPVPSTPGTTGAPVDVSAIGAQKTLVLDGPSGSTGEIQVEGSTDGSTYCPITKFIADNPAEQTITMVLNSMRCKRLSGSGATDLAVGGQAVTSNQFVPLDENILDTSGLGTEKTIIITGDYDLAPIVVEGSNDDANFDVVAQFDTLGSQIAHVSGDYKSMRLRSPSPVPVTMGAGYLFESASAPPVSDVSTLLEQLQNQSGGPMGASDVVMLSNDLGIVPADGSTTDSTARTIGVLNQNLDDEEVGAVVTSGQVQVSMATDVPSVTAGDPIWLSTTEIARATNIQPSSNNLPLGTIKDGTGYEPGGLVTIDLYIEKTGIGMALGQRIVIGDGAQASANSIVLGQGADGGNDASVVIGQNAGNSNSGTPIIAIGLNATASSGFSIAIGRDSSVTDDAEGIAIGNGATIQVTGSPNGSIAIGGGATVNAAGRAIAIGRGSSVLSEESIAIRGTVFGPDARNAVAIRGVVNNESDNAVAIKGSATGDNSIALGGTTLFGDAIAIGRSSEGNAFDTIAIGRTARALATHDEAICIGRGSSSSFSHQCTIGGDGGVETGSGISRFRVQGGSPGAGIDPIRATSVGLAAGETGLTIAARIGAAVILNKLVFDEDVGSLPVGARVLYIMP